MSWLFHIFAKINKQSSPNIPLAESVMMMMTERCYKSRISVTKDNIFRLFPLPTNYCKKIYISWEPSNLTVQKFQKHHTFNPYQRMFWRISQHFAAMGSALSQLSEQNVTDAVLLLSSQHKTTKPISQKPFVVIIKKMKCGHGCSHQILLLVSGFWQLFINSKTIVSNNASVLASDLHVNISSSKNRRIFLSVLTQNALFPLGYKRENRLLRRCH